MRHLKQELCTQKELALLAVNSFQLLHASTVEEFLGREEREGMVGTIEYFQKAFKRFANL